MSLTNRIVLEIIVSSFQNARAAASGGADRFELCAALAMGGLTPSLGLLDAVKREFPVIRAMFMLRPREGGMAYAEAELSVMQRDAELALEHGADGLVFGVLTDRGDVDAIACKRLIEIARQRPGVQWVFHRAFDLVNDPAAALEQIIDLGFARVLTSGRAARAIDGLNEIRRTRERAAGRIEVLPGGGITSQNVAQIVLVTGVNQVHASLRHRAALGFNVDQRSNQADSGTTDPDAVRAVRQILDSLHERP
jgi:copper homeostasis protein CutC